MILGTKKIFTCAFLLGAIFSAQAEEIQASSKLRVMSYNVQNLFDTVDDPRTNDSEFTPNGKQHWTEKVLADKIRNLGVVIGKDKPDVIGIVETENQEVLERFVKEGLAGQGYNYVVAGPSSDDRGIRNGIVSKFPIVSTDSHQVWDSSWTENGVVKKTRDILEVTLKVKKGSHEQDVTYLVNHWPSRAGSAQFRDRIRLDTAKKMKKIVEKITQKNPSRLVVALGDYNDELEDPTFIKGLQTVSTLADYLKSAAGSLFAVDAELDVSQRGTYYYHQENRWNALDHILIAEGSDILKGAPSLRYVSGSVRVSKSPFQNRDGHPQGCETFGRGSPRTSCPNGASDHLPVVADFAL